MEQSQKYSDNTTLLLRSLAGDEEATEELLVKNAPLVRSIAQRFIGRGTDFEDLVQIGTIGLFKAIRTFDPERGCAFSTYAVPLIFGEIRRHIRDDGPIKVSRAKKRLAAILVAEREKAVKQGENIRLSELAQRCGVTLEEAADALDAVSPVRSLSETLYGDEDGPTLGSALGDDESCDRMLDHLALSMSIDRLPPLKRKIILLRYFRDLSQQETADILGLTQVKVSREEKKILAILLQELS